MGGGIFSMHRHSDILERSGELSSIIAFFIMSMQALA